MISVGKAFIGFMMGILVRNNVKTSSDNPHCPENVKAIDLDFTGTMNIEESQIKIGGTFKLLPQLDGSFIVDGPLKVKGFKKIGVSGINLKIGAFLNIQNVNILSFDLNKADDEVMV